MNVTDEGRRCSEAVNTALMLGACGKWVAVRLSDGRSDGGMYDTKKDAIRLAPWDLNLLHETQAVYIKVPPGGMPPEEATAFLEVNRKLYSAGMRLADPDLEVIMPYTKEDINLFLRGKL